MLLVALCLLYTLPAFQLAEAQNAISFSYPHDDSVGFLLLGDAVDSHGVIELTERKDPEAMGGGSAGRFLCRTPIRMVDPQTRQTASFITSFSFRIYSVNSSYQGDGMAFIVVPDNYTVGSSGELLGAFTPTHGGPNVRTFAVEFDTWQNPDLHDPNGNHVGLDGGNISSFAYNNASNVGVQLNDGSVVTAWIKYDGVLQNLQVRISVDSMEPVQPLIDANVSFASLLNEYMYVGFSGSTGLGNEAHTLMSWTFSSWGLTLQPLQPSETRALASSKGKHAASIALAICLILVLVVLVFGLLSWKMAGAQLCGENYFRRAKYYDAKASSFSYPRAFTYRELSAATRGFRGDHKLGVGSFYRGVLADSDCVVAVKRVMKEPSEGLEEFLAELQLLSSNPHHNLVPVLGWCVEKGQLLLVYEFIPNESLDKYLFSDHLDVLPWSQRYHIITGVVAGLVHMHEGLHLEADDTDGYPVKSDSKSAKTSRRSHGGRSALIHRDVKSSNVILDNNFNARLGDYGLRRLMTGKQRGGDAMILEGTFGYIAPEVVQTGKMTARADVFGLGVLVLEVACGRRAISEGEVLLDVVWELECHGCILGAADKRLNGCFDESEMIRLLRLGLLCTLTDPELRPAMSHVRRILHGDCPMPELPRSPKLHSPGSLADPKKVQTSLQISISELLSS